MTDGRIPDAVPLRVKPSLGAALVLYVGYLTVFFAVWIVNDVDYVAIGKTTESAKLHYALPTLFGSAYLVLAVTAFGWWRITLFDRERGGPRWAWIGPIGMFAIAASSFALMNRAGATLGLVMWSVLGGIGVGFGEEMITRGALVVGLRATCTEGKVWLYSTLLFSALHIPNALFGEPVGLMLAQLVLTFIFGSLLYATRRLAGTLLLPMFLHGFWDSSVFLPQATDSALNYSALAFYPIAVASAVAVVHRNRGLRVS